MADAVPSETPAFHNPSTRRIRLAALPVSNLPSHTILENTTSTASLTPFITETLAESLSFTDTLMHSEFQAKNQPTKSAPSTAPVQLLVMDGMKSPNGKAEMWFGRRSIHEDSATSGSASYAEFENGLFHDHNLNEGKYTPDVFDARQVLSYGPSEGLDAKALAEQGWEDVDASIWEMGHQIPGPLTSRVFSVLVIQGKVSPRVSEAIDARSGAGQGAQVQNANGFVTAQIPVDLSGHKAAFYASGRHRTEGETPERKAKIVMGEYVSVERVRRRDDGKIAWEMATASDAKGFLPLSLQKMGVPAAVLKDVGYFMKFCEQERKGGKS